jgi:hypothetical protein
VVADAGKVFDPSATYKHDAVFLQVMSFAGDIGDDFLAVREPAEFGFLGVLVLT